MKKVIILLFVIFILSGCAAAPSQSAQAPGASPAVSAQAPAAEKLSLLICLRHADEEYDAGARLFADWAASLGVQTELKTVIAEGDERSAIIEEFIVSGGDMFFAELEPGAKLSRIAKKAEDAGAYWCSAGVAQDALPMDYARYICASEPDAAQAGRISAQYFLSKGGGAAFAQENDECAEAARQMIGDIELTSPGELSPVSGVCWLGSEALARAAKSPSAICAQPGTELIAAVRAGELDACVSSRPREQIAYLLAECFGVRAGIETLGELTNTERYYASKTQLITAQTQQEAVAPGDWRSFISRGLDWR